ncbi:ATP-grasp fold amidoligase family protein [Ochrovirga pacifica]|uniref:ATP-grasp fold amidoligase family protein n=1 Tax=Ochrovirga pacifica TaxID=1042376 RepID=UPI000255A075|nr:ATP-grasp fold amidoligase family protein [Ochrovirga pacifica]
MIRPFVKKIYNEHKWFKILFKFPKKIFDFYRFRIVDEKRVIYNNFYKFQGYQLNLENPKTFNEKIQWLKLNDRTPLHTQCADKYMVRDYVAQKVGEQYLIPLVFHTEDVSQLTMDKLPDYPVIIKTNHDSGNYVIVRDKKQFDLNAVRNKMRAAMKKNYYYHTKEWQYKNIKPRVVVEKLLMQKGGSIPYDYKVHCIHGKVEMISVDLHRGTKEHRRNWYDINWQRLPFDWASILDGVKTVQSDIDIEKPNCLDEMVLLSEKISSSFKYARVDWYEVESKLYFGEITFHHDSGFQPIEPNEWDLKIGAKLKLQ